MKSKIGIIGSGQVARVLATGFVRHGHEVMMGSRDVKKLNEWKAKSSVNVITGSFHDAAAFADMIVLAVKGGVAVELVRSIAVPLRNKIVLDTTNPIADAPPRNGVLTYFTDTNDSLMERLQRAVPEARFVKCFNSVGNAVMIDPEFTVKPTMFICGNDDAAKKATEKLLAEVGWETADMGKVEGARAIEPLCMLWCIPGFLNNQWGHAFKLLNK